MSMPKMMTALPRLACVALALATFACASEAAQSGAEGEAGDESAPHLGTAREALTGTTRSGYLNIAQGRTATQSSTGWSAPASRAVDGNTDGSFWNNSVTHTNNDAATSWQVTLAGARPVSIVTVWNRTDCCGERLAGAVVELLDAQGNVVAQSTLATANIPTSQDVWFNGVMAVTVRVRKPAGGYLSLAEVQVWMAVPTTPRTQTVTSGLCWKNTYGRGVGTIPTECGAGKEKNGLLCYDKCAAGYAGAGPVCWQTCPAGYTDDGALCRKNAEIIGANNSSCPWYDVCGLTFSKGCSTCPAGYANDGCTCRKNADIFAKRTYGRGVGSSMSCASGKEMDAGLCYTPCTSKFGGAGPVCWAKCGGDYPVECGLACATDAQACVNGITNMALTTANAFMNLAGMVEGWGEAYTAISAVKTVAMDEAAQLTLRSAIITQLRKQAASLSQSELESIAGGLSDAAKNGTFDWTALDPTGVAAVVNAFNQPVCTGM